MALLVDIEKTLGNFHLRVKFKAENNVLSLLGASGCGKSMTLKCIAGIERPDRGHIVLDGRTLFDSEKKIDLPPQQRRVGYLFQQYALFPNMTVAQNIAAAVRDKRSRRETVARYVTAMRLEGLEDKKPHQLSGGQQQRVALARILANEPDVLLLDEPFSALDSHLRFQLENEVRAAIRRFGKTVVLVSHNRDEVFRLSDAVAIMNGGRIEALGSRKDVFARPVTRSGAILTGCKNVAAIEKLDERHIRVPAWGMTLETAADVGESRYAGIRMHDIIPGGGANSFVCRVAEEIENPFSYTIMLRCGDGDPIGWEMDKATWLARRAEKMTIALPPEKILLLME